ncbi:hypothetical protein MKEN_00491200 [Mycena kentingensis (nom. inval.)]|nr:hypothetical protein MKEN_00491200 [Mycena kentingensis (nom. inval.)]
MLSPIAIASAALVLATTAAAQCTPTFSEGVPYIVSSSQQTDVQWIGNNTEGSLGVDLSTTLPGTQWQLATTDFGGYAFSFNTEFNFCLVADGSAQKISADACFDETGSFTPEQDFTFACDSCSESGASNCRIVIKTIQQCAAGENVDEQVRIAGCGSMPMAEWNIVSPSNFV